jgi:signal transduction histidine kinase
VTATLDTQGVREPLSGPAAGLLYRATQEALRNTLAHAGATTFSVRLASTADLATLEIGDDGRGFDPESAPAEGHVGLKGVEGLIEDAGGSLEVRSSPGAGTQLRVELPLR